MPAFALPLRILSGSLAAMLLVTGCQTLDEAGRVVEPSDLANDLANRLDQSARLTYSAEYQLPGGHSASIVQDQQPTRTAYTYPGGKLTLTDQTTTECDLTRRKVTCIMAPLPSPSTRRLAPVFARAGARGLATPPLVINLLTAAALDPDSIIEQSDTTVAGQHATCVRVKELSDAPAPSFTTCVTTEGTLGSFTGVVNGKTIDIAMSSYRDSVDESAFELPEGAKVIDRRRPAE